MIKPTVGRVVWYYPHGRTQIDANEQPHAAIIAYVHGDDCINLAYFDSNGNAKAVTSVYLWQGVEPRPSFGFAQWMPYQLALQKQLGDLPVDISAECKSDPAFDNLPRSA